MSEHTRTKAPSRRHVVRRAVGHEAIEGAQGGVSSRLGLVQAATTAGNKGARAHLSVQSMEQVQRSVGNQAALALLQRAGDEHAGLAHAGQGTQAVQRRTRSNAVVGEAPGATPAENWEGMALAKSLGLPKGLQPIATLAATLKADPDKSWGDKALGVADGLKTAGGIANLVGSVGAGGTMAGAKVANKVQHLGIKDSKAASEAMKTSTAGKVDTGASGALSALSALSGLYEGINSGIHTAYSAVRMVTAVVSKDSKVAKDAAGQMCMDALTSLRGYLNATTSAISASRSFMSLANAAAAAGPVLPIVGSAISIVAGAIDTIIQTVEFVKRLIKLVTAHMSALKMQGEKMIGDAARDAAEFLKGINVKRQKRAILGMIQNFGHIVGNVVNCVGSILNIIGVATAAGDMGGTYVAGAVMSGIGSGIKGVSSAVGGIASAVRGAKQQGRNFAAGDTSTFVGKIGKKMGDASRYLGGSGKLTSKIFNEKKSSGAKEQEYNKQATNILVTLQELRTPDEYRALANKLKEAENRKYEQAINLVSAAGVDVEDLVKLGNGVLIKQALKDAMKQRD